MNTPPEWLAALADEVAARIQPLEAMGPIGCHYFLTPSGWEITVFPALTEVVGGPYDGQMFGSKFEVDVVSLLSIFTQVTTVRWQSQELSDEDELGAHLSIEGHYHDEPVWVRVPAVSPKRFEAGRQMHVHSGNWQETW